jgi:hypothetical protein
MSIERGIDRPSSEDPDQSEPELSSGRSGMNRREFLRTAAIGAGSILAVSALGCEVGESEKEKKYGPGERFKEGVEGFEVIYGKLRRNQILFVNENDGPIGDPVELVPFNNISPGSFDQNGLLVGSINPEWLAAHRKRICEQYPEVKCNPKRNLPRQRNVIQLLRQAVGREGLNPETYLDVVKHYGQRAVVGAEEYSRIEYVRNFLGRNTTLPEAIIAELSRIGPGLAAQESRFDNSSKSPVGARGIFQFMPATFKELGYSEADFLSLTKQVEAAGEYFQRAYRSLYQRSGDALQNIRAEFFDNDELFAKEFIVPILINSYNAGAARMAAVVTWFNKRYPNGEAFRARGSSVPKGYDVFKVMSLKAQAYEGGGLIAGYGSDAGGYVPRIYAFASLLER